MSRCFIFLLVFLPLSSHSAARQSGKIVGKGADPLKITLTDPKGGWTVDRMLTVAGQVSDTTVDPITVTINGDRFLLRTQGGRFKRAFPVTAGKNSIVVSGTNLAGSAHAQRTVYAQVSPVALMLVLTSDTDGIYTDLHVYEPAPGLKDPINESKNSNAHVFWASTSSPSGGKFYLNEQGGDFDEPGYGPYLYTHVSPPLGIYRVDANYWPSGDKAHTLSTLNIVLFGGKPQEMRRTVHAPLAKPGETVTLAWIRIDKGQKAAIYTPVEDPAPKDHTVWPKWVTEYKPVKSDSSEY